MALYLCKRTSTFASVSEPCLHLQDTPAWVSNATRITNREEKGDDGENEEKEEEEIRPGFLSR